MSAEAPIYLDHNATTPIAPEVLEAMLPYLREHFGNPSSAHVFGQRAKSAVEAAREQVAQLLGAAPAQVVFTGGGTEANNLAIFGVTRESPRRHLVTSVIEHPATSAPCARLEAHGWRVSRIGVDAEGRVDAQEVAAALTDDTALVTIMHANNETGALQPIREVASAARARGIPVHTDAAQSAGKLPVHDLGANLTSIAGHKLYAPKGVGALSVGDVPLSPYVLGASHERGLRHGTENVASIVGLGAAAQLALARLEETAARLRGLRDGLWWRLRAAIPQLRLNGPEAERLPNTLNVSFPAVSGSALLAAAPELAASTGSACHDGHESASAVLLAMGLEPSAALGAVRLSLGHATTEADVERAANALVAAWKRLQS